MKKIVVINASPRKEWNTGSLVREAARGAEESGAVPAFIPVTTPLSDTFATDGLFEYHVTDLS